MGENANEGLKIGIVVLILVAIIAVVIGIYQISRNVMDTGMNRMQQTSDNISSMDIQKFDQRVVNGTEVLAAINQFKGQDLAILIATQAFKDAGCTATGAGLPTGAVIASAFDYTNNTAITDTKSDGSSVNLAYINYNAILKPESVNTYKIYIKSGYYVNKAGKFLASSTGTGNAMYLDFSKLSDSSNAQYVDPSGKFQATLIKDMSGKVIGIAFNQLRIVQ